MREPSRLGLRGRVALLIALCIAPVVGLLLYTGFEQRRLARTEVQLDAERLARLAASSQDGLLLAAPQFLSVLAHVPQVRDGDARTCTQFLSSVRSRYPLFLNIGRVAPNGDITSSALPTTGTVSAADRSWFRGAMQTRQPAAGEYQIGRITGQPSINFAEPILDASGRVKWVIFAAVDLSWIERVASRIQLPEGATLTVTDRHGIILARYPHDDRWVGQPAVELKPVQSRLGHVPEGTFRAKGPDGVARLYAIAPVGSATSGALLSIGIPESTAFDAIDRLLARNLIALLVIALVAIGVAFYGMELLILRSLRLLIAATEGLARGDLSVRTGLARARWELGQLALAFDEMADALQQRAREHQQVEKRNALLLQLYEKSAHLTDDELYAYALDQAVALTDSTVGFFHQVADDQQSIVLTSWNQEALRTCTATPSLHYPVEAAGNWADCVRLKGPVVYNDYPHSPNQRGLPEGHAPVTRFMSIPVMDGDKVKYAFGVGNKPRDYDDNDVVQLQLVANELYKILQQRQSAEALRESETKFRFLFDTMAQGVVLQDNESRIIEANQAACDILGVSMDQLLGRSTRDPRWKLIHEDGSPLGVVEMPSSIALRTGQAVSGLVIGVYLPETDTYRWILTSSVPRFKAGDDKPYVTMTTFTDVTERKRTEEELSRLSTLLDQTQSLAGVGGWEIDVEHNTLYWTSETYRTHDLSPSEYTPTLESSLAFYTPESRPVITAAVKNAVEHGTNFDLELDLITARGRPFTSHLISKAIVENGKTVRVVGAGVDITERKQAEQALRDSEERFRTVFDSANDAIMILDGSKFIDCNARAAEMFGCEDKAEVIAHSPADFSPAKQPDGRDSREEVKAYNEAALAGTPQRFYWAHVRKDGTAFDAEVSLNALVLKGKTYIQAVVRDITARKQAEEALRDSEEQFRAVFESANDAILLMDGDTFIDCNAQAVEMYGCDDKDDVIAHTPLDFSPPDQPDGQPSRQAALAHINAALDGTPQRFYWLHIRKDGTPFDAEVSLNAVGLRGKTYILAIVRDISERRRAEDALLQSEQKFRSVVESSPTAMHFYKLEPDGRMVLTGANPAANRTLGTAHLPLVGKPIEEAFPSLVDTEVPALYRRVARRETGPQTFEMPYGDERFSGYYHVSVFAIGPGAIAADFLDISERKRTEEALLQSEQKFRSVVESSPTGMVFCVLEPDGRLLFTGSNPMADRVLGVANEPRWGMPIEEAFPGIVGTTLPELYRKVASGEIGPQSFEVPYGDERFSGYYAETVFSIGPGAIVLDFTDITERKRHEEALRQAHDELELRVQQRTAELSRSNAELQQFAYVASHDLQEPLRKIMAFGDRLQINAGPALDDRNRDYLERMLNAAGRMAGLINALLAYSRITTKARPFAPVNLSEVAAEVLTDLEVAREEAGASVEVGELPTIDADASQMRQLLQNLIANAIKFRREGVPPLVRVEAEVVSPATDEGPLPVRTVMRLRVIDNGIGFEEKYADRIFEVFERLHGRDEYGGSGIGLAICRKIAERHHGTISASSEPGTGSVFTVTLPVKQWQEGSET